MSGHPAQVNEPGPAEPTGGFAGQPENQPPAAEPAAAKKPYEGHPEGPFAGIVTWAQGEFARLEAMIKADMPKAATGTSVTQPSVTQPSEVSHVTQPHMPPTPNLGGTKE